MTFTAFKAAASALGAAAILAAGSAAHADGLHAGYAIPDNTSDTGLASYDGALNQTGSFVTPREAVGLAAGGGSLFVSSLDGPTNYLERYGLDGVQTGSYALGPLVTPGALAFGGGALYGAFATLTLGGDIYSINDFTPDFGFGSSLNIILPTMATGLAYGDGNLFVAYDSTLARYDLTGQLLGSYDFGTVSLGALTYGAGQLFAAYQSGASFGFASVDPLTFLAGGANVSTDSQVNGLAFGDGGIFASFEHGIARYDLAGQQVASLDTGRQVNGPLAYAATSAAPEPAAWALMILGFGAAGAALRSRRRPFAVI